MRKINLSFIVMVLVVMIFSFPCRADNCRSCNCNSCNAKKDNFGTKLGWGVVNILMAPVELVKAVTTAPYDRGLAYDLPVGVSKGFYNMGKRIGAGTFETATFPVPSYEPLLKEDREPEVTTKPVKK